VYQSDSIYMREREMQNVEKSHGEGTLHSGWERCAFELLPVAPIYDLRTTHENTRKPL